MEGNREIWRARKHDNLDFIISVGYRIRSHWGTQSRIRATQRLRENPIKGFAMGDARLKEAGPETTSKSGSQASDRLS